MINILKIMDKFVEDIGQIVDPEISYTQQNPHTYNNRFILIANRNAKYSQMILMQS